MPVATADEHPRRDTTLSGLQGELEEPPPALSLESRVGQGPHGADRGTGVARCDRQAHPATEKLRSRTVREPSPKFSLLGLATDGISLGTWGCVTPTCVAA